MIQFPCKICGEQKVHTFHLKVEECGASPHQVRCYAPQEHHAYKRGIRLWLRSIKRAFMGEVLW